MRLYATFTPFRKGRAFIILRSAVMGLSEARRPYGQAGRRMYLSFRFYRRVFLGGEPPRCAEPARAIAWGRVRSSSFLSQGIPWRRATAGECLDGEPPRASVLSVYASKFSLPGDCHVANACPARSIATSPLWLKTVTCGLFLRHFVPPRRAHNDKALRLFAWSVIRVRSSSFLPQSISQLMPLNDKSVRNLLSLPPRGKVDCRSVAKARRMRGKRR